MFRFAKHALLSALRWTPTKNRKRILALFLAAAILTAFTGYTALAQIIGDPYGYVAVGTTSSDNPSAQIALANGGTANGGVAGISTTGCASSSSQGIAVSAAGTVNNCAAGGLAGISGMGTSVGSVAVSGAGPCAWGGYVGVAGTGCSVGTLAISGTGNAYGGIAAISAAGDATGNTLAVSPTGCAHGAVAIEPACGAPTVGDPAGLVAVGPTHYDSSNATLLAVANGGPATTSCLLSQYCIGSAATTTNNANGGLLAVSGTGCASSSSQGIAISAAGNVNNCAAGGLGGISGMGTSVGSVAVSGTGPCAWGGYVGVAGTGCSVGTLAIGGTGNSYGSTGAVSGAGNATGSQVAVSGAGTADAASLLSVSGVYGKVSVAGTDVIDNTGVAEFAIDEAQAIDMAYVPPADGVAVKEALQAAIGPWVDLLLAQGLTQSNSSFNLNSEDCGTQRCPNPQYANTQPLDYQKKQYTCAPESTRLVLWQMRSVDFGEAQMESEEHTRSSDGTVIGSIPKVLNAHQNLDTFAVKQPKNASDYMQMVVADVNYMHHSLIENVQTQTLPWWSKHRARHYHVVYGYDTYHGGHIFVAEEYDPTKVHSEPNYLRDNFNNVNPYGPQEGDLATVSGAVAASPSHSIIW